MGPGVEDIGVEVQVFRLYHTSSRSHSRPKSVRLRENNRIHPLPYREARYLIRHNSVSLAAVMATAVTCASASAQSPPSIPLVSGLTIVSALRFPDGDRENIVIVTEASSAGARYSWSYEQHDGSTSRRGEFTRFVRASDLAGAPRLDQIFLSKGAEESPGFTAFSISRAVYQRLHTEPQVPFTVTSVLDGGPLGGIGQLGNLFSSRITMRGTLALASPRPEPMSLLVNGQRVSLPTLKLTGHFSFQGKGGETDIWVVADSTHPLIVRVVNGRDILQTIRIDLPVADAPLERALTTACRAELPGIYFGFGSAALDPASEPALAAVAQLLAKHADWTIAIEGHTDSIGGAASNQTLSERRAEAVRSALSAQHHVAPARLAAAGFGAKRPRETNATIEGRARNRRVELVRPCAAQ